MDLVSLRTGTRNPIRKTAGGTVIHVSISSRSLHRDKQRCADVFERIDARGQKTNQKTKALVFAALGEGQRCNHID